MGGLLATVRDITERKLADEALRESEARHGFLLKLNDALRSLVAHSMGVVYQNLQLHNALAEKAPERAREKLAVAEDNVRSALDQTRSLAMELRRSVADETEDGLAAALRALVDSSAPDGVAAELSLSGDDSLIPQDVEAQVYLVMREAIRNTLKHPVESDSWRASR